MITDGMGSQGVSVFLYPKDSGLVVDFDVDILIDAWVISQKFRMLIACSHVTSISPP